MIGGVGRAVKVQHNTNCAILFHMPRLLTRFSLPSRVLSFRAVAWGLGCGLLWGLVSAQVCRTIAPNRSFWSVLFSNFPYYASVILGCVTGSLICAAVATCARSTRLLLALPSVTAIYIVLFPLAIGALPDVLRLALTSIRVLVGLTAVGLFIRLIPIARCRPLIAALSFPALGALGNLAFQQTMGPFFTPNIREVLWGVQGCSLLALTSLIGLASAPPDSNDVAYHPTP